MDADFMKVVQMTEEEAREKLEAIQWPKGMVICPKCGSVKGGYKLTSKPDTKNPVRPGLYKCKDCRQKFTVTMGTVFEDSHIPLHKWFIAIYLMNASKKGISSHQLHRMLGVTYRTAWFMTHRIRLAMTDGPLAELLTGTVEGDEVYVGGAEKNKHEYQKTPGTQGRSTKTKTPVAVLVERDGEVRAKKVANASKETLHANMKENVDPSARIHTDEWTAYQGLDKTFSLHEVVNHRDGEFARGDVTTNSAESWISLLRRGVYGTFHHVSEKHLDRYVQEFVFRWNHRNINDGERMTTAVAKSKGKRLMYKDMVKSATKKTDGQPSVFYIY